MDSFELLTPSGCFPRAAGIWLCMKVWKQAPIHFAPSNILQHTLYTLKPPIRLCWAEVLHLTSPLCNPTAPPFLSQVSLIPLKKCKLFQHVLPEKKKKKTCTASCQDHQSKEASNKLRPKAGIWLSAFYWDTLVVGRVQTALGTSPQSNW